MKVEDEFKSTSHYHQLSWDEVAIAMMLFLSSDNGRDYNYIGHLS